jgi:hypothetical protein
MAQRLTAVPKEPEEEPVPAPAETEQPGRVFGLMGAPVMLAQREFHFARFTTAGIRALIDTFGDYKNLPPFIPSENATLGEMTAEALVMGGASMSRQFEGWLRRVIVEEIPEGLADDCLPEEAAVVVDSFFHASGFNLLARTVKNSLALDAAGQDDLIRKGLIQQRELARLNAEKKAQEGAESEPQRSEESEPSTQESSSTS